MAQVAEHCHEVMSKAMTLAVIRGWDWREYAQSIRFTGSFSELINNVCEYECFDSVIYHPRFSQALFGEHEQPQLHLLTMSNDKMATLNKFVLRLL